MSEQETNRRWHQSCLFRFVLTVMVLAVLICGGAYLFFYCAFNCEYDRATGVAARVLGDVEHIYRDVRLAAPYPSRFLSGDEPRSSIGHLALSDGAPQYAWVGAEQDYSARLDLEIILEHYDELFRGWGWSIVQLDQNAGKNGDVGSIQRVYQHPTNERLLAGICQPELAPLPDSTAYTIFFDFSEEGMNPVKIGYVSLSGVTVKVIELNGNIMIENIYTIGVYGSTEDTFFDALLDAKIDLFVDVRVRRGLRGKTYAYANSAYLQDKLKALNIDYLHYLPLAPTAAIKQQQEDFDKQTKTARRQRETLSSVFIETYTQEILAPFEVDDFLKAVENHKHICLFCVEQSPDACHRSLAAARISELLNVPLIHLTP